MTVARTVLVKIVADAADYIKNIDTAEKKTSFLSQGMAGLAGMGTGILTAGFAAAGVAIAGGTALLVDCTREAMAAENAQAELNAVLESTKGKAGMSASALNDLANSLSQVTKFEDDVIVEGESMLLTFTNIGSDVFPAATEAMLNMAEKFGGVDSAAMQLGKALNDPIQGVQALRRVGVQLSDVQEQQIKDFMAVGDVASAQAVILSELETEFGGLARAAGATSAGQLEILKNNLSNIKETVGGALLPVISKLATTLSQELNKPEVKAFIESLSIAIGNFANKVVAALPGVIAGFQNIVSFLQNNQGVVIAIMAVIAVAVCAALYSIAVAAWAAMSPLLPIIAIIAAVAAVAYLLYEAWNNNFLGIKDALLAVWAAIQPVFEAIRQWLGEKIPIVVNFIKAAFQMWWGFMQTYIIPVIAAVANVLGAVLGKVFEFIGAYIKNVLVPAWKMLFDWINDKIMPVVRVVAGWLADKLAPAFSAVARAVQAVCSWLASLATKINNIQLPSWLQPGSPTPFETGLWGIRDALKAVAREGVPELTAGLNINAGAVSVPAVGSITGGGATTVVVEFKPFISLADEEEAKNRLAPFIKKVLRDSGVA